MSAYEALADWYDRLTEDVDYSGWADWLERHFRRCDIPVETVLDLACGTGSLSCELARRGYEVIGVDLSPEMLTQAADKAENLPEESRPLFLCQSMERLNLYNGVDACVCCLDSVNYVTRADALKRAFGRVYRCLNPGGCFIFDINTPEKLRRLDGQTFLDEDEDVYCVWRADFDPARSICSYGFDLFHRQGALWCREEEYHEEKAWEPEQLRGWLEQAGFSDIRLYGDRKLRRPKEGEDRIFFVAIRK